MLWLTFRTMNARMGDMSNVPPRGGMMPLGKEVQRAESEIEGRCESRWVWLDVMQVAYIG